MNKLQQAQLFRELEQRFGTEIANAFLAAIATHANAIDVTALAEAITAGDLPQVEFLLRFDQGTLFPLGEAIRAAFIQGGLSVAQTSGLGGLFGFNGRHDRALQLIESQAGRLIEGIQTHTQAQVQAIMAAGVENGTSGATLARQITGKLNKITGRREGGFLGLTSQQTDWAISARAELTRLDPHYFTRVQRDRRFDAMVRKAIDSGKPLSQSDIDRIAGRYRDRLLKYRGELIARHEAHSALAAGQYEGNRQLHESGLATVTKTWIHGFSKEPRLDHLAMAQAPQRPIDQPFTFGIVAMQYPHDPAGGIEHSANCKCTLFYRVTRNRQR